MKALCLAGCLVAASVAGADAGAGASTGEAARAINALGLELHRSLPAEGDACVSPYSIQAALAMTYLGANGETRAEMARVLHFAEDPVVLGESFAALSRALEEAQQRSKERAAQDRNWGGNWDPLALKVANRLYGQRGYPFRESFLARVQTHFGAPLETVDFVKDAPGATRSINAWVGKQTRERITELIPAGALKEDARLVLVNALYFKSAWEREFDAGRTKPRPFHLGASGPVVEVPTMVSKSHLAYHTGDGFRAVVLPYRGRDLQFLLIVPDALDGAAAVARKLTPDTLLACGRAEPVEVELHLPKFKLTPPTLALGETLQALGLKSAFDQPRGSANFDAMAPRKPDDYLYISAVFHKTFVAVDEKGTEAAAATAVAMAGATAMPVERPKPVVLRADRPFLFAIQHAESGACLFLGRVSDPR